MGWSLLMPGAERRPLPHSLVFKIGAMPFSLQSSAYCTPPAHRQGNRASRSTEL